MIDEPVDPIADDRVLDPLWDALGYSPPWIADLFVGIGILVVSWYLAKLIVRFSGRPVARRFERPSVTRTVLQSIRVIVLIVALLIAARVVGFEAGAILLSVTVFSAILAVVLAPIVGRFISGLFVLTDRPFEIGDMIELEAEGIRGYVEDVTLRYTKLFTVGNTLLVIPNSTILERDVINYSAEDERTRQRMELLVTYEGDLDMARTICEESAARVPGVIGQGPPIRVGSALYPASPRCLIDEFADDGIRLILYFWVDTPYRLPRIRSHIFEHIWEAIEDEPVEIAYPHQHLVFDETSGTMDITLREE